ncbi:MAG: RdgB/HAM1 family non-canonical purine NTP pyrophosphatase [Elusimicrobiota bacterium]|jgi:XTP/dITP diphosphohydrolase|nr:RdgB/HAM1 family non-canonical purine NTP pyrophosphatase [Elusimicrobiota bacterium]
MAKEIILATANEHKVAEIKIFFKDLKTKFTSMTSFEKYPHVIEDGKTLEENAVKKAKIVAKFFNQWTLADDTGLEVDFLNGKPGVHTARYAGNNCSYQDNSNKLLEVLKDVLPQKRTAVFKTVIALANPAGGVFLAEGKLFGIISTFPCGNCGFGYDAVFYLPECKKTLAEFSLEEKSSLSHRAKALKAAKKIIEDLVGE